MNFDWLALSLFLVPAGWWLAQAIRRHLRARRLRHLADLAGRIEYADLLGFLGRHDEVPATIETLSQQAAALKGDDGVLQRALCLVIRADLAAAQSQPAIASAHLESALTEIESAEDPPFVAEMRIRIEASLGLLATIQDTDDALLRHGEKALAGEGAVVSRDTLVRLVEMCQWLGHAHHHRGRWERARPFHESAVRIAERLPMPNRGPVDSTSSIEWVFWSRARAAASAAAVELGAILCSLGEHETGLAWLDRAAALLEGGESALSRFALAKALLARASHEPADPVVRMELRRNLLTRASEAGLASGWPGGRCAACEAELGLAMLQLSLGAEEDAVRHLRRAYDHVKDITDPDVTPFVQHPMLILARILEERGDNDGAREHYRLVLDRGREDLHPESRRFAAVSAYHLHRLLAEQKLTRESGELLTTLDALVPTCAPEARTLLSGLAARSKAVQQVHEKHPDEARASLVHAEELGRQADSPEAWDFVREVAGDLGRLALSRKEPEEAAEHFRRALDTQPGQQGPAQEQAERSALWLQHSQAMMALDRETDADRSLRRAYDEGRASGQPHGREVAAMAAMLRAHHFVEPIDERRRLLETARSLGRLSGRPRGREIVAAVEARLREMTE